MNFAEANGITIKKAWWKFHKDNPHVYQLFEELSMKAIRSGKSKLSAKMIINVIRWEHYLKTTEDTGFKINDAFHAFYGRLFMHHHPEYQVFETRRLRAAQ